MKWLDASNGLYAQYRPDANLFDSVCPREAAADTPQSSGAATAPEMVANQSKWVRALMLPNIFQIGIWNADPEVSGNAPVYDHSFAIPLGVNKVFNPLRRGQVGLKLTFPSADWSVDDFKVQPMTV